MSVANSKLSLLRLAVFGLSTLLSLAVLGISASMMAFSNGPNGFTYYGLSVSFENLALVAAIFSLICLPAFLVVDFLQKGSIVTAIVCELPCVAFLTIMWISSAGLFSTWSWVANFGCGVVDNSSLYSRFVSSDSSGGPTGVDSLQAVSRFCGEFKAAEGLSFVNWIMLLIYIICLLTYAATQHTRGRPVWMMSVSAATATQFGGNKTEGPMTYPTGMTAVNHAAV